MCRVPCRQVVIRAHESATGSNSRNSNSMPTEVDAWEEGAPSSSRPSPSEAGPAPGPCTLLHVRSCWPEMGQVRRVTCQWRDWRGGNQPRSSQATLMQLSSKREPMQNRLTEVAPPKK